MKEGRTARPRSPTILVVEDDPGMRQYLRSCLEPLGARIEEVTDGRDALELLQGADQEFDLVISDILMPGMGGLELVEELEAIPALALLPVLFVTGELDQATLSGRPVLQKPFNGPLLRLYVEELLADPEGSEPTP